MPRNSSGAYSLPAGNPVISNTLIETNWANPTMADIGQALTESLDRYGRGGMLAPFRLFDGTVTAPALSFASETSTGIYRTTAGTWNLSILGVNVFGATATGVNIVPPTTFQGTATFNSPALRAVDPATGNELTRKTYVDNAISAAVGGGTLYVKRAGDTMGGNLTITTPQALWLRSGVVGSPVTQTMGRVATEGYFGVSGGPGNFTTGDVAGDMTLRSEQRLYLSIGAAGHLRMAGTLTSALGNFEAIGPTFNPSTTGVQLGNAAGSALIGFTNMSGAADSKKWDIAAFPAELQFRFANDAYSIAPLWMQVRRNATTAANVVFPGGTTAGYHTLLGDYAGSLVPRLTIAATMAAGGADGLKIVKSDDSQSVQLLLTGSGYNYAGVLGNETWLYAQGATPINIGPDGNAAVKIITNAAVRATFSGNGLIGFGRVNSFGQKSIEVQGGIMTIGDSEGLRIASDTAFISFHNAASTVRTGYIQFNAAGGMIYAAENGTYHQFNVPAMAGALTVNSTGCYNGPGAPSRLVKVSEFAATTSTAAIPGLLFRFGRAATTVGATGTISFSSAMGAVYSIVATLEGGVGGGWVLRTYNHTVSGFQFAFDSYNSAGGGAACVITYWAVGS